MKRTFKFLSILLVLILAVSCGGENVKKDDGGARQGPSNHGQATGYATIFDNDTGLARDKASDDASRKLVETVLGNTVSGSSMVQDFQLVSSIVESSSTGMVKNQRVIKEGNDNGTYYVTLEGDVFPAAVGEAIRAAIENYGRPKFMILLNETFEGKINTPGMTVTELTMMEIMGNAGFEFVDAATVLSLMEQDKADMQKAMRGQINGNEAVQDLVLQDAGAEVIIYGEVKTSDQTASLARYNPNMKSKQAIVNLKAVDVYTGAILAATSHNAPGMHIDADTASKNAIQACLGSSKVLGKEGDEGTFESGDFMNQITRKFLESATRRPIQLKVAGLNAQEMIKFRDFLSQRCRGVKKVEVKGQQGSETKLEVLFSGKTVDLTDEFANKADEAGFSINIVKSYPNKIQLIAKKTK